MSEEGEGGSGKEGGMRGRKGGRTMLIVNEKDKERNSNGKQCGCREVIWLRQYKGFHYFRSECSTSLKL